MKIYHKLLLSLSLLPLFLTNSDAQEQLTLSDAIQLGLANNFDIRIERLNVEIAENNNNWGEAGRWPTISLTVDQNNNFRDVDNPASFLQGLTISNDLGPGITMNWVLFDGFRVQIARERLQKLQELSMGNAQVVIENAVQAIITQYYLTQLEKERLDVLQDVFELSKDRYEYIKLKGELGSAVTFDILQEQTAFLTDSSNYVTQADTRLAKTELYPRLSFSASGAYTWSRQDLSNAEFAFPNPDRVEITRPRVANYAAGFTLSYLLFDGGRVKRSIENAYTTERIRQLQIDQLKLSLRNDLVATYDLYEARKRLLSISEENVRSAALNLELADERFQTGTINSFDFRQIQVNYLNTALNNLQARFDLLDSETELLRLTGGILNEYENVE